MLLKEESHCWPIGIWIGGIGGFVNEILRETGGMTDFKDISMNMDIDFDPFEEEIRN